MTGYEMTAGRRGGIQSLAPFVVYESSYGEEANSMDLPAVRNREPGVPRALSRVW